MLKILFALNTLLFLSCFSADQNVSHSHSHKIKINTNNQCSICFEKLGKENALSALTCQHVFHMSCLEDWNIVGTNNCPNCRADLANEHSNRFSRIIKRFPKLKKKNKELERRNIVLETRNASCKSDLYQERKDFNKYIERCVAFGACGFTLLIVLIASLARCYV